MLKGGRLLYLVGFMGSGKSVVARQVAQELSWEFTDIDSLVENKEGRSIGEIFATSGEKPFRKAERQALRSLSGGSRIVVATGGGLFMGVAERMLMKQTGVSLWLDPPLDVIRERLGEGHGRPLWNGEDPIAMRALYEKRRATYALADFRVDPSRGTPEEIAKEVLDRLARIMPGEWP